MITNKQAFHHDYSDLTFEFSQHDELAAEALGKISTIQCYLDEVDCAEIAVLAMDGLTQSVLHMTAATVARNKATAIYLCELFNANDISVTKGLKDYRSFIDQFDGVGSAKSKQPWT